jgi:hypothetical protein
MGFAPDYRKHQSGITNAGRQIGPQVNPGIIVHPRVAHPPKIDYVEVYADGRGSAP